MADPRITFMADQLQAEFIETGKAMFEEYLHGVGLCSDALPDLVLMLVDTALLAGSTATMQVLQKHGRMKGAEA